MLLVRRVDGDTNAEASVVWSGLTKAMNCYKDAMLLGVVYSGGDDWVTARGEETTEVDVVGSLWSLTGPNQAEPASNLDIGITTSAVGAVQRLRHVVKQVLVITCHSVHLVG